MADRLSDVRITPSCGNIFRDLGFSEAEAHSLTLRSELMSEVRKYLRERRLTQSRAAKLFGVTQPRISDLMRGKIGLFSLDALINMLSRAGMAVHVVVKKSAA